MSSNQHKLFVTNMMSEASSYTSDSSDDSTASSIDSPSPPMLTMLNAIPIVQFNPGNAPPSWEDGLKKPEFEEAIPLQDLSEDRQKRMKAVDKWLDTANQELEKGQVEKAQTALDFARELDPNDARVVELTKSMEETHSVLVGAGKNNNGGKKKAWKWKRRNRVSVASEEHQEDEEVGREITCDDCLEWESINPMRLKDASHETQVAVGCCYCFVLIISVVLFALSFQTLQPLELGLDYNGATVKIDESKVYTSGRHFLGLGHSFIKFPAKLVPFEYSNLANATRGPLFVASSSGQPITLSASVYIRLQKNNLVKLFKQYSTGYEGSLDREIRETIKNQAVKFDTLEFFTNREAISSAMFEALQGRVKTVFSDCVSFQMRFIDLPDDIEDKLLTKIVTEQLKETTQLEQAVSVVRAETAVINAAADARIVKLFGVANGTAIELLNTARAKGYKLIEAQRKDNFDLIQKSFGFTDEQLKEYMYVWHELKESDREHHVKLGFTGRDTYIVGV
eukprot:TRINITY_DN4512_c0_g1_i1.p1 TRINITY_DN4512_c0_g1~~TRINITY_DN4512_c0_g1_i1.p1  ORF type:complete len:510 (+),score=148.36 TRINITY_DN4512_c0_g1_i1:290-1819(+)